MFCRKRSKRASSWFVEAEFRLEGAQRCFLKIARFSAENHPFPLILPPVYAIIDYQAERTFREIFGILEVSPMKGYFISVEGGDGSGKSTQIKKIEAYLRERGQEVLLTREPGGTPVAEKIRELILDPANKALTGRAEMLLYAASRAQHVEEKILPALAAGKTVLSDRFTDSSIAYQAFGRGLGDMVAEVNRIATGGKEPDLTIFLNITPSAGMARKNQQADHALDRLEQEQAAFHEKVYEGYLALVRQSGGRIADIDADRPAEAVFADIKKHLDRVFGF